MKDLLRVVVAMLVMGSCSGEKQKLPGIMGEINALPELKIAGEKIDSLNKIGIAAELEIMVLQEPLNPEDSSKNIAMAFIQGNYGVDEMIFYEIRFDRTTEKIISVEKK